MALVAIVLAAVATKKSAPPPPSAPVVASASEPKPAPATLPADAKSVAVRPFENRSTKKEKIFADAMHDVLLTTLARIGALKKVTARTSVLPNRDPAQRNLQPIATQLGVAHVVAGSVSRAGSKVRILVKVTDAATDLQRSAEPSIGDLSDGFKWQADLSAQIAQWLSATISPDQKLALAQKLTSNPAAYDLDLRARRWRGLGNSGLKTTREGEELIIRPLEQAVAIDPAFAAADAELSQVHLQL